MCALWNDPVEKENACCKKQVAGWREAVGCGAHVEG